MKIAITNSDQQYVLKMKDTSGDFAAIYIHFVRDLLSEVGVKQEFLPDWDFGVGVEPEDTSFEGNYVVYEVPDFVGYLILEYQRDLRKGINKWIGKPAKQYEELVQS